MRFINEHIKVRHLYEPCENCNTYNYSNPIYQLIGRQCGSIRSWIWPALPPLVFPAGQRRCIEYMRDQALRDGLRAVHTGWTAPPDTFWCQGNPETRDDLNLASVPHQWFRVSEDHPRGALRFPCMQYERTVPDTLEQGVPPISVVEWAQQEAIDMLKLTTLTNYSVLIAGDTSFSRLLLQGKATGLVNLSMGNAAVISTDGGFLHDDTEGEELLIQVLQQLPPETPLNIIQVPGWFHGDDFILHDRMKLLFMAGGYGANPCFTADLRQIHENCPMLQKRKSHSGSDSFWGKRMTLTAFGIREVVLSAEYAFQHGCVNLIIIDYSIQTVPSWKRPLNKIAAYHRLVVQSKTSGQLKDLVQRRIDHVKRAYDVKQ